MTRPSRQTAPGPPPSPRRPSRGGGPILTRPPPPPSSQAQLANDERNDEMGPVPVSPVRSILHHAMPHMGLPTRLTPNQLCCRSGNHHGNASEEV
ncbi:hypothetical protein ACCO45_010214 [Purpureocillium lilacinum]|uniref:Uncharacterized protein n=1 Tax=Purpureocillium lilacinum TaxID=33203 RepID=A0ACC4DEH3_PURLI